jgi:hypothetical protein
MAIHPHAADQITLRAEVVQIQSESSDHWGGTGGTNDDGTIQGHCLGDGDGCAEQAAQPLQQLRTRGDLGGGVPPGDQLRGMYAIALRLRDGHLSIAKPQFVTVFGLRRQHAKHGRKAAGDGRDNAVQVSRETSRTQLWKLAVMAAGAILMLAVLVC